MELKRILAKDARSANEEAASLYGGEVMVISCSKVGTQTELIVAVDTVKETPSPLGKAVSADASSPSANAELEHPFAQVFELAKRQPEPAIAEPSPVQQPTALPPMSTSSTAQALASNAEEALERLRGQELVSLVREEIASLRREFHLSRLGNDQAGAIGTASPVRLLHETLIECHAPAALRASLVNGLLDCNDLSQALEAIQTQLGTILRVPAAPSLLSGVHALCGPSGAGKTMMAHRILAAASRELAIEDMALVSCADHKPGAWSQVQILAAQTGVDIYRARDLHALPLLLEELGHRKLIVIDTAGSDPMRQAMELSQLDAHITLHAVLPTDASSDQFRQLHSVPGLKWGSLMLSKSDEQRNPWPLLGFLSGSPTAISVIPKSDRIQDGLASQGKDELVRWAMDKLQNTMEQTAAAGIQMPAMLPRDVAKTPVRVTKPRVARAAKPKAQTAKSSPLITCLQ
jgi:flagellar biosynthesis protein FlhF